MIDTLYFTGLLLISIRLFAFFAVVPIFFPKGTPGQVKVGTTIIMAYILIPGINYTGVSTINSALPFFINCVNEGVAGIVLGIIVNLCFISAQIAGSLMDLQIGFSMMTMFDPMSNTSATLLERILYWFTIVIFFIVDGHHMVIHALIDSFNTIKLGTFFLSQASMTILFKIFIQYFVIGIKIAAPIILIIFITDLTMGLISRTVPQLNIMILGMPIKILIGLTAFSLALPIFMKMLVVSFEGIPDALKGFYKTLPVLLIFMSDDKTEEATPRKKSEARKKGQVARSKDVSLALTLAACTLVLTSLGGYAGTQLKNTMIAFFTDYLNMQLDYGSVMKLALIFVWRVGIIVLPMIVPIMIVGIFSNYLQTGWLLTTEPLKPDLKKLNPISGFKRMFSIRSLVQLLKDSAVVSLLGYIGYKFIKDNYNYILTLWDLTPEAFMTAVGKLVISIFFKITLVMVIIAALDFLFQKRQYNKELKMTKQEVKEEFKQDEGDPHIKGKIKQKQREIAMRRMIQEVPKATVVVTNPTHISVALKYEEGQEAPVVVAKGQDKTALKIKEVAKENDVPIIENKPLARLMYERLDLDQPIPLDMYQAVAEILALVYKINKK